MPKVLISAIMLLSGTVALFGQSNAEWLEDYAAIKKYMAEAYANIDLARTRIDLVDLDRRTTDGLKQAKTTQDAQKVLMEFFGAFRDGHLRLQRVTARSDSDSGPLTIRKDSNGEQACRMLGFTARPTKFSLPFEQVPGFSAVSDPKDPFLAGIFPAGSRKVAVLNIALFSSDNFFGNCVSAWESFRYGIDGDCNGDCQDRFRKAAEKQLTEKFVAEVRALTQKKPDALVIDIATNGGGNNWVETIAEVISKTPVRKPPVKFIRHPHWVKILESRLADVDFDLARKDLSKAQKSILKKARKKLLGFVAEAREPCDLAEIWTDSKKKPDCTRLSAVSLPDGLAPDAPAELIAGLRSRDSLKRVAPFEHVKGIFDGKLFVLVDRKTASASEMFASMLQSARSATIIGGQTLGAGCGYVDGGTEYFLPVTKLRLRMPDCSRFRSDGVNEVVGIEPDIKLFGPDETADTKLSALLSYFSSL